VDVDVNWALTCGACSEELHVGCAVSNTLLFTPSSEETFFNSFNITSENFLDTFFCSNGGIMGLADKVGSNLLSELLDGSLNLESGGLESLLPVFNYSLV